MYGSFFYLYDVKSREKMEENQNQINIELPEDIAEGEYANLAIITHSNQNLCSILCAFHLVFQKQK